MRLAAAAFAAIAASAAPHVAAAGNSATSLLNLPAATAEPASTARVLSEAPFQRFLALHCSGQDGSSVCRTRIAPAYSKERVVIQFASCIAVTSQGGELGSMVLGVTDAKLTTIYAAHFLAPAFRGGSVSQIHAASQPMLLSIDAGRHLLLETRPHLGTLSSARCGLTGVKQRLG